MISFALLFLAISLKNVYCAPDCPGTAFDLPADTSEWTWYPNNFQGAQPPLFPNNFNCNYKINVPQGWSVDMILTVNMTIPQDFAASVQVFDQNQNREVVYSASAEHYFFIANGGSIQLNTREQNIQFGFALKWSKFAVFAPSLGNVTVAAPQPLVLWASNSPYQIKAETRVSLVIVPPKEDFYVQYLRSVMIFDGPDWNSPCLGNALQAIRNKTQLVSTGKYMTFSQLRPYYQTGRTMLILQDYENTKDIGQYLGFACVHPSDCGTVNMDGTTGLAAISTINDDVTAEYLTKLSGTGTLDVYIGGKTTSKANLITSYRLVSVVSNKNHKSISFRMDSGTSSYLPQEFLGYVRTYVLTGPTASLNLARSSLDFSKSSSIGRKGFLASRYYKYGVPVADSSTYDFIKSPTNQLSTYSFIIRDADFVGNTSLSVSISKGVRQSMTNISFVFYFNMLTFLIACFIVSRASTYSYEPEDNGNVQCDRTTDIPNFQSSEPYYFPSFWNENISAPIMAHSQHCCWTAYVPVGYYAFFAMNASIGGDSLLNITDYNGKSEIVMSSDLQPYIFVGKFTIDLTVGAAQNATSFGFRVQWSKIPDPKTAQYSINKTSDALYFDEMLDENSVTVTAETRVSLTAFPSDYPDLTPLLRLTLVFDGPNITSPYIGTLFQAVRCNKPMVSQSNKMTIFTFEDDYIVGSYFVIQDYYNVQKLTEVKGITCWSQSSCPVTLNAANGPVSAMTLNFDDGDEFVKRLDLSPDAVLKFISELGGKTMTQTPLLLMKSNQTFLFKINVTYVDVSNDAELTIGFGTGSGVKEYKFSNETSQPSFSFSEIASNMTVTYFTNETLTKGFYLDFKIESAISSSFYASTFWAFLTVLIFFLMQ
ncbi:hypothetical protein CRE_13169 [Caenorhabditis remanei]|uniref:CUB-like domain-containing protein n=1 Tax=Caenorhabditis remanei TaxID=31234 RepID=E3NN34_CAERE|nr:hypothetical protein CRE_13169 [Caenorhabditis remanei]